MRSIVDKILWGTLLVLFGPSVMVVASWNALPGDNLYGVKLALERTALTLASPSYATAGTLHIKYTERRYAEARQLLASKQSIRGLPYLEQQIAETKKAIENAPSQETQVALAKQYINTLTTVSNELEEQKTAITTTPPAGGQPIAYVPPKQSVSSTSDVKEVRTPEVSDPVPPPTQRQPTSTATPSPRPTTTQQTTSAVAVPTKPAPTATPTPSPTQIAQVATSMPIPTQQAMVALQIDQTQQNVSQTIADLQALVKDDDRNKGEKEELKEKRGKEEKKTDQDNKPHGKNSKKDD